ncbi:MAG: RNA 2',3'-cyclic phosphodiesterase [Burkholderiales bacterium]
MFFALWPPAATLTALVSWADQARPLTGGKVIRAEAIHLTLVFLGEVSEGRVGDAIRAGRRIRVKPDALPIEQAKVWSHNSIVCVGPHQTPRALGSLVESLRAQLQKEGFAVEQRPFAAHVTLIRKARRAARLPPLPALEWPVREFTLVRSSLSGRGSSYEVIDRIGLVD